VATGDGFGEPWVAVDPQNPNVLAAAHAAGVSVSRDGGRHWKRVVPITPSSSAGDPTVVSYGPGDFFFTYGAYNALLESTDGGTRWTQVQSPAHPLPPPAFGYSPGDTTVQPSGGPVYMGPSAVGCDRPLVAGDGNTGAIYVTCSDHGDQSGGDGESNWPVWFAACRANELDTVPLNANCGRRYVSTSYDHGHTWTPWQPEDSAQWPAAYTGGMDGIIVAGHGILAAAYVTGPATGNSCANQCAMFETSRDAGKTWMRHLVPGATPQLGGFSPNTPPGELPGCPDAGCMPRFQAYVAVPYLAADPAHPGHYAIMLLDATDTELLVYETVDFGASWVGPAVLRNGPDQVDKPGMAFGPSGALGVFWKSVHADQRFDAVAAVSPFGNLRFGHPVRLATSDPETCGTDLGTDPGEALGCDDMSWMVMDASHLDAIWGANVGGHQNPWFGRYDFVADPQFPRQGCPLATGRLSGLQLGPVRLGMTRQRARRALADSSTRKHRYMDFFCLTPNGIRVGYASTRLEGELSPSQRQHVNGRVVLALTANPRYALRGVRPGMRLAAVARKLRTGAPFHIGLNWWYLTPGGQSRSVLKVRHGIIEEIGIADGGLTRTHQAAARFLRSFF
jgi:hypothetical protein